MELIIAYYGEKIEIAFGQVQLHSSQGSKVQDFPKEKNPGKLVTLFVKEMPLGVVIWWKLFGH